MIADCATGLGDEAYVLSTIGGGIIEAAIGEGDLQRGSSRLESESRPCLLEDARENRDLLFDMLALARLVVDDCLKKSIPVHDAWNASALDTMVTRSIARCWSRLPLDVT